MKKLYTMKKMFLLLMIMFSAVLTGTVALAATEDSSTGSFTIDTIPTVSGVDFQDDSYTPISALTPDASTYHRVNFTIASSSGISDILNATIYIFDDSTHSANYDSAAEDGLLLTSFMWTESSDVWSVVDQGSMTGWDVDTSNSDDPGAAAADTSYEFSMRFLISKGARADTSDWNCTVHVFDDDDDTDSAAEATLVTMSQHFEIVFDSPTFSWGNAIQPSSVNNTHGALVITVLANDDWKIQLNATDFSASAESDVDIEAQNILAWDEDGSNGGSSMWVRNTLADALGTWTGQSPMTTESGFNKNAYFFLSPGTYFVAGKEWSVTVTAYIVAA